MSDETDTTSEVARVLRAHEWRTESGGVRCRCRALLPTVIEYHDHQAAMLAEARLLAEEDAGTELLTREREDTLRDLHARYHDEVGNLLGRDECGWEGCEYWDAAEVTLDELDRAGLLVPQIATQEPAGATRGGSGDSRTLADRLRAAADYQDRPGAYDELRAMADEADVLESALNRVHALAEHHRPLGTQIWPEDITRASAGVGIYAPEPCGTKSEPFLIRDSDQKPIHYLVKTCHLPAGHGRPHHWPVLTFVTPGFTEEA